MPLNWRNVALTLLWGTPAWCVRNAPKDTSGFGGPACCRICQNQFNNELNFLELDEDAKVSAAANFARWSQETMSFVEISSEPDRKAPCCSVCVADFVSTDGDLDVDLVAREGPFSMIPHDPQAPPPRMRQSNFIEVEAGQAADSFRDGRKKSTHTNSASAMDETYFLQVQTVVSTQKAGSGNLGGACCNVCSAQSPGIQLLTSKVVGYGGGTKRTEGGCCTACGSRYYGASEYGAPPFSEPGNREQNIGAPFPSVIENMDEFGGRLYNPTHKQQATVPGFTKRQIKLSHAV